VTETTHAHDFQGRTLLDADGEKIGKVEDLYSVEDRGEPEWALVKTGLLGTRKSFVPLRGATPTGEDVRLPITKEQIKDAPGIDADEQLSEEQEHRLFDHYGVSSGTPGATTERSVGATEQDTGDTDEAMTRSEDELHVGIERRERGRARLRKYVTAEQVEKTVPVRREEARVEREPIRDENVEAAMSGPDISESEHEVTLVEEEPVVEKRTVPKERVRLDKDVHTDEQTVTEELRTEHIEAAREPEDRR
jgi:uncharacterized protein (TIGR02271 family)